MNHNIKSLLAHPYWGYATLISNPVGHPTSETISNAQHYKVDDKNYKPPSKWS